MSAFTNNALFLFDILGTIAFAISGATEAIKKRTDILGVCLLGCTTAMGGGIFRDMVLGNLPPRIFLHPLDALISLITSLAVFLLAYKKQDWFRHSEEKALAVVNVFDAIGLGVFTVVGMQVASELGFGSNCGLTVFAGVISAIGGGLVRDVILCEVPFILTKRIYALASLVGGLCAYGLQGCIGETLAYAIGILIVFVIRMIATVFRWDLPRAY